MQSPMSSSASVESFTSLVSNLGLRQKRSGTSNNTSVIKPVRSIKELNKHIEETQMKMFQESQKLPGIMREVQKVYDQTHETIELQLHHRRDIANKLNTCNQQYVNIFEQMLEEVMKMQRVKYKSHIALIEELREEMINFEQFVGQQHENLETSHNEKAGLRRELEDEKKNGEKLQGEIARLTNHIKHLEGEKVLFPMAGRAGANALSELELKNKMSAMKHEFKQQLEHKEKTHQLEVHSLKRINQELEQQIQEQLVTIEILRKESSVFSHIDKVQMKRPSKDSATQTEVNDDDGLWDRQDGWILPVSSYIIARARWRASLNFVTCPSCRGIGRYIAQVASELKRARMGVVDVPGLETSTITTGNNNNGSAGASNNGALVDPTTNNVAIRKWILPDELILFLSNLPRSVQAINPFSLLWTAKRVYLILDGKLRADRDDFQMGFRPQSLVEYCIEIFLRNAPSRAKAEINLYVFVKSLKEHYQQCTLLKLFAKLLGVSDSSSNNSNNSNNNSNSTGTSNNNNASNNNATNNKENSTNPSTRKTIRDKDNNSSNNSSSRQTQISSSLNNHYSNSSKDKEITTPQKRKTKLENPYKDPEVFMNEHALSKEILAICLFARECLFSGPYNGVYAQAFHVLRQLRRVGEDFEKGLYKTSSKMFARTNKLPSNLNGTDALDSENGPHHQHLPHGTTPNQTTYPLPSHVFVDALAGGGNSSTHASSTKNNSAHCVFYVPLDRAIHVIIPFMEQLSHNEVMSILHAMEDHTRILQYNQAALEGKIYNPEGQRSFVRSIVRLFAFSENHTARDIDDWQYLCDHYEYRIGEDRRTQSHGATVHNSSKAGDKYGDDAEMEGDHKEDDVEAEHSKDDGKRQASHSSNKKSAKTTSNNNKHGNTNPEISDNAQYSGESYRLPTEAKQHTLVIDAEYVLLIISEIARRKLISVEQQLKRIFEEGDVNHDNVLSFEEFSEIVFKVDAECPDRKILRMFREALILGGDKDVIGPQQYLTVCKDFNLIRLVSSSYFYLCVFCNYSQTIGCVSFDMLW
jgi:predicted  nucleic acid-binding Zn-ribbon protein